MYARRRKKVQRNNEQKISDTEEEKPKEEPKPIVRAKKPAGNWIEYIRGVIIRICKELIGDNLIKLREMKEEEIPGLCKAKACKIVEMIEAEVPDLKIAAHVTIGHRSAQGLHDVINAHYETPRDVVETVFNADDKFFIEANVAIIPIKIPAQFLED